MEFLVEFCRFTTICYEVGKETNTTCDRREYEQSGKQNKLWERHIILRPADGKITNRPTDINYQVKRQAR